MKPRVLIFSGYGLNCEEETKTAFEAAGAKADIRHLEECIERPRLLLEYEIIAFPGGFSYGDHAGSGKAYAARLMHHLGKELESFLGRDTLMIGICNGFQILTSAGILPGALLGNDTGRFTCRWVDVEVTGESPWLFGMTRLSLPVAHGEGKYFDEEKRLDRLEKEGALALTYVAGDMCAKQGLIPNPNGSLRNIAGVTARDGRVLGLMPHPERGSFFEQRPDWTLLREGYEKRGEPMPRYADGIQVFRNAVRYFD